MCHQSRAPFTPTFRVSSLHTHIQSRAPFTPTFRVELPSHPHSESAPFTPTFRVSSLYTHIHVHYHISKPCYHYYPTIIIIIIIILFTCMYTVHRPIPPRRLSMSDSTQQPRAPLLRGCCETHNVTLETWVFFLSYTSQQTQVLN